MVDVPQVPGVPSLPSYSPDTVALLFSDVVSFIDSLFGPQWGIYLDGAQAFPYNSIVDFDFKQDFPVSDYQQEDGGFQSYDKVQLPFDVRVRIASGGDPASRQELIESVQAASSSLDLFDVVTPEQTYSSCCITHVDYKRQSHNGVGLVIIDLWFVEIRITSTSTFSNTQTPAVAGQQNIGNLSPTPADNLAAGISPL